MSPVVRKPAASRFAIFSTCGFYRYSLTRVLGRRLFGVSRKLTICMLNPSTATATTDDPTVRRCMNFAIDNGFDLLRIVNLFAWRATDSSELRHTSDPVGPQNNEWIKVQVRNSDATICAWGNKGRLNGRAEEVWKMIRRNKNLLRFGPLTKLGEPSHPLYLPGNIDLQPMDDYRR